MGLFGFVGKLAEATIKTALTPLAVVSDTVSVVTGQEPNSTSKLIESVGDSLEESVDKLIDE
jgi:hypothetical protein